MHCNVLGGGSLHENEQHISINYMSGKTRLHDNPQFNYLLNQLKNNLLYRKLKFGLYCLNSTEISYHEKRV